jgi:hypothetical protein
MQQNATLYLFAISATGALIIGALGAAVGAVWALGVGADFVVGAAVVGVIAALWGAIVVRLTPTGGVILENRTTVNYAVFALHAWYAVFVSVLALAVWAMKSWVF